MQNSVRRPSLRFKIPDWRNQKAISRFDRCSFHVIAISQQHGDSSPLAESAEWLTSFLVASLLWVFWRVTGARLGFASWRVVG
jgi:hypothetical protein